MKALLILFLVIAIIFAIFIMPLALIWSINTLFNLKIAYTFLNWVASFFLIAVFAPKNYPSKQ